MSSDKRIPFIQLAANFLRLLSIKTVILINEEGMANRLIVQYFSLKRIVGGIELGR